MVAWLAFANYCKQDEAMARLQVGKPVGAGSPRATSRMTERAKAGTAKVGHSAKAATSAGSASAKVGLGTLGEFLKDQRRGAQLTLRQLADQAGVSNPYLSQI